MSLYDDAILIMYPSGIKAGKIYSVKPTDGTGDLTFTRASTATRVNENGLIESVAANVPRIDFTGGGCGKLLIEPQRTNLLLNSDTLSTQNVTTAATDYTISFYGTGTVTLSGTYTGSLIGTGTSDMVTLKFTATAGTLTATVSGTVSNAQIEAGSYATSYIPTAGSAVTRLADASSTTGISSLIGQTEGVFYVEMAALVNDNSGRYISISDSTNNNRIIIGFDTASNRIYGYVTSGVSSQAFIYYEVSDILNFNKVAFKYKANDFALWINGVKRATDVSGSVPVSLTSITFNSGGGGNLFYGKIQELMVFPTALSDAELEALTTL